jgi:CRP/FNR family cyclic AMP-dependent transcriptional regulator
MAQITDPPALPPSRCRQPGCRRDGCHPVVDERALSELAARGELRRYRKGTLLIQEATTATRMFIIQSGRLRVFSAGDNDREITYGVYGPGEYLGEISLDGGPRSASVITLEACTCSVVTRRTLERFIAERPGVRLRAAGQGDPPRPHRHVERAPAGAQRCLRPAEGTAAGRGLQPQPDGTRVVRPAHAPGDGQPLGCSREMVSRLMKDLERGGYLQVQAASCVLPSSRCRSAGRHVFRARCALAAGAKRRSGLRGARCAHTWATRGSRAWMSWMRLSPEGWVDSHCGGAPLLAAIIFCHSVTPARGS